MTLADVGRLCEPEVTRQAVSAVLAGESTSERIETALALAAGIELGEVQMVTRSRPRRAANDRDIDGDTVSVSTARQARQAA